MVDQTLSGHVGIISGAAGDIGRAIARELGRRGAEVALGDVREPGDVAGLLGSLKDSGVRARYDAVDVTDAQAVKRWVGEVTKDLGPPDLIVPNAAVVGMNPIRQVSAEAWSREMRINLDGAFHLARAGALGLLAQHKPGRIVFIGSWAAHRPHPHIPAYSVAKAGLRMLCKCMALDLAPDHILVNEVAPGYVNAGLSGKLFQDHPERHDAATRRVPVGRLIQPEDVAMQVTHLCDPSNQHTTGSVVLMDGGLSLLSGNEHDA